MNKICENAKIAETVIMGPGCYILGESVISDESVLGWNVTIGHPSKATQTKHRDLSISSGSVIGKNCIIRSGTVIYEEIKISNSFQCGHNTVIRENVVIGNNSSMGSNVTIEPNVSIGDNVRMQGGITIAPSTKIGNNVFFGPNVVVTDGRLMTGGQIAAGRMTWKEAIAQEKKTRKRMEQIIEDDVRIGANAVILAGVKLEKGCIVGAGALVSRDVPPKATILGNPGRIIPQS